MPYCKTILYQQITSKLPQIKNILILLYPNTDVLESTAADKKSDKKKNLPSAVRMLSMLTNEILPEAPRIRALNDKRKTRSERSGAKPEDNPPA